MVVDQRVLLVRHRAGAVDQLCRTVHLVPMPPACDAGVVAALCGRLLCHEQIETVPPGEGVPCQMCLMNQAATMTSDGMTPDGMPASDMPAGGQSLLADVDGASGLTYHAWGWPVTQRGDLLQLRLDCDTSAIAIPIPLSAEVTQVLTDRHCAPAVLAHPYTPEHHMVLTGERFGATLPWPSGVYQVTGAIMLPPTMTICGPITWVRPPGKDSLRLSREIDVFGALRTALSH
jgi:hypothetical protein